MKPLDEKYIFIGKKIKEVREAAGWAQKELADKLGFESSTAISLIESGLRRVGVEDLDKIADLLHKDISYFLGKNQSKVDLQFALRADKNLSQRDKQDILNFIDFIKSRKNANRKS